MIEIQLHRHAAPAGEEHGRIMARAAPLADHRQEHRGMPRRHGAVAVGLLDRLLIGKQRQGVPEHREGDVLLLGHEKAQRAVIGLQHGRGAAGLNPVGFIQGDGEIDLDDRIAVIERVDEDIDALFLLHDDRREFHDRAIGLKIQGAAFRAHQAGLLALIGIVQGGDEGEGAGDLVVNAIRIAGEGQHPPQGHGLRVGLDRQDPQHAVVELDIGAIDFDRVTGLKDLIADQALRVHPPLLGAAHVQQTAHQQQVFRLAHLAQGQARRFQGLMKLDDGVVGVPELPFRRDGVGHGNLDADDQHRIIGMDAGPRDQFGGFARADRPGAAADQFLQDLDLLCPPWVVMGVGVRGNPHPPPAIPRDQMLDVGAGELHELDEGPRGLARAQGAGQTQTGHFVHAGQQGAHETGADKAAIDIEQTVLLIVGKDGNKLFRPGPIQHLFDPRLRTHTASISPAGQSRGIGR